MAKGKTHDKITIALSPLIVIIFLMINVNLFENKSQIVIVTVLAVSIYLFGGFMFSGDLDIKSMEYYRWGKLKFIWNPYQSMFKHRSIFTHGFLLGPIIRVIYIYIILLIVCGVLYSLRIINLATDEVIKATIEYININKLIFINIGFALFLGSGLHTITDFTYSFIKKKFTNTKGHRKNRRKFIV